MQQIGLKAVLEMSGFQSGMRAYLTGTKQMETETEKLLHSIQPLGVAMAGLGAAGTAFVRSAALTAARTEELSLVLGVMAKNAHEAAFAEGDLARASELTAASVDGAVKAIKEKGIETQVATMLATQFIRYELDMAKATDLARVAQDAAVYGMQDSSVALDGLLHGILTYNPLVLRTYGLNVQAAQAFKDFADANNIAVDQMDSTQRAQAMLNAVLEEGTKIEGTYEAAMESSSKLLRSVTGREWKEFLQTIGEHYLPAMDAAVEAAKNLLEAFNDMSPEQQKMIANMLGIGTVVTTVSGSFILLAPRIIATGKALGTLGGFAGNVGISLKLLGAGANVADLGLAGLTAKAIAVAGPLAALVAVVLAGNAALEGHHEKTIALSDSYERYVDMMRKTGRAALILTEAEWEHQKVVGQLPEVTGKWTSSIEEQIQMSNAMVAAEIARQEALKPTEEQLKKLAELEENMANDKASIAKRVLSMERDYNEQLIDMAIDRARAIEDIDRNLAAQRASAAAQLAQRLTQIEAQASQQTEQAAYQHAQRMAQIEEQYQERLRQIQETYEKSRYDAIRSRDALALLNAERTRKKETDEAKRERDKRKSEASADYARQQAEQKANLEAQRQAAIEAYQQQMADLKETRRQQEEELDRSQKRQLEDLERHNQWTIERMRQEFQDEYLEAMMAYSSQETLYASHLENMRRIWETMGGNWGGLPRTGERGIIGGFQHGGAFVTGGPTTATFGEGGVPELVVAQPLSPVASQSGGGSMTVSGTMRHEVSGAVSGMMDGYEGRLSAMISQAVMEAFTEVLRR